MIANGIFLAACLAISIEYHTIFWDSNFFVSNHSFRLSSAKVLVVMNKVGQFALPIDGFASITDGVGQRSRPAAEHANFANLQDFFKK